MREDIDIVCLKGYNLSEGKWGFNDIKRQGGRFLWKQIVNVKRLGVRTVYGAMWDEYVSTLRFNPFCSCVVKDASSLLFPGLQNY